MSMFSTDASRWAAVQSKDPAADGAFVYCVRTTQIYCRPTCKARLARRANVMFADRPEEAEEAGFRSCKRCKPNLRYYNPHADLVARACLTIREKVQTGELVALRDLATEAGMTESHFHRVFKGVLGITPKEYARSTASSGPSILGSLTNSTMPSTPNTDYPAAMSDKFGYLVEMEPSEKFDPVFQVSDTLPESRTQSEPPQQVDFTIQPWSSFYVSIAVADNSICAIDTADTYSELISEVQRRFPQSSIHLSDWSPGTMHKHESHFLFDSVMSALENPTGKLVNLSADALSMHSVMTVFG